MSVVDQVGDLIKKIQEAYVETLEELSWMDEQSKEKAREKVTCYIYSDAQTVRAFCFSCIV